MVCIIAVHVSVFERASEVILLLLCSTVYNNITLLCVAMRNLSLSLLRVLFVLYSCDVLADSSVIIRMIKDNNYDHLTSDEPSN